MTNTLGQVQSMLDEWIRKSQFKKANLKRQEAIDLQNTLGKCRGKLERSAIDLQRTIKAQSKNIREGKAAHQDTIVQEQILWDAALAYMLVRDAIYALKTVNSYDSVCHANEMLDAAMQQITGKKRALPKPSFLKKSGRRNAYGYITSETAVHEKEELLDSFFQDLKNTGDIDSCLAKATYPADKEAANRHAYTTRNTVEDGAPKSDRERMKSILTGLTGEDSSVEIDQNALDSMSDIH